MVTYEDKAVKTSTNKNKIYEDVEPESYKFIESIDKYCHGDFVIYYYFEIITEKEKIEMTGSLGKRIGYMGTKIPYLNKVGKIIYLN